MKKKDSLMKRLLSMIMTIMLIASSVGVFTQKRSYLM